MYVCMCVCAYVRMCVCVCARVCARARACARVRACMGVGMGMRTCTCCTPLAARAKIPRHPLRLAHTAVTAPHPSLDMLTSLVDDQLVLLRFLPRQHTGECMRMAGSDGLGLAGSATRAVRPHALSQGRAQSKNESVARASTRGCGWLGCGGRSHLRKSQNFEIGSEVAGGPGRARP